MIYGCQWRHVREQHITTVTVLKETGLRHIDTYLERRRIRWAGHVARMGWHRTPRKLLSAWAYQEDGRSWGRPMKRWAESFEEDLKGASIPVSKWHKLAQDKENWKDLISETGEESKKSKAKKKRNGQWNPQASCGAGCTGK